MAKLIERDGKQYCVEEDGTEWEYAPALPSPPQPKTEIELLREENAELKTRVSSTEDAILTLMDLTMM